MRQLPLVPLPDIKSLLLKTFLLGISLHLIKTEANYEHHVTVTKVAEESTENADYQLEYSIVNDALTRVHASIRKKDTDGSGNAPQIGIIYMEQGVISCNIPMGEPLAPLFHDFDTMIDEIKKSNVQNA